MADGGTLPTGTVTWGPDDAECYIPITPAPERTKRNMAIWREAGERLGLVPPPAEAKDDDDG